MKNNMIENMTSRTGLRHLFLMVSIISLLAVTACTSSSHNSQRNWNRTPASTGHNRCGCLLIPSAGDAIKLYQQPLYVVQA